MKYVKFVNVPLSIFANKKYGNIATGSRIPWEDLGFNKTIVSAKTVQYTDVNGDHISYLPISDEEKFNSKLSLIQADINPLDEAFPDKEISFTVLADDYENWKAEAELHKEEVNS